jgi:hypothetical protein
MKTISRRHLLRGAGVALALPALDLMRPLHAAAAEPKVRRSVFIYIPNGVNTLDFQITKAGADYEMSASLRPLEKHRASMTPISGLHHPSGLGHHHNCVKIWLTGGRLGPSDRNTISVDQLVAQKTAPLTRFSSLELSLQGGSLSWTADGIQLPAQSSPGVVFRELFEDPKGGIAGQRRGLQRRGSILDAVLGEAKSLGSELGADDRGRLEQYLTSVREVEVRTQRADGWLDAPRPKVDAATQGRLNRDVSLQMLGELQRTMYDLIVLAFRTDMTRVVTFSTGAEGNGPPVPELGIRVDRHSLSHHNGHPDRLREFTQADVFHARQFAYFLDRLAETKDAEGPLLDTTMALYGSGMSYGHSHGNANLPLILAGGSALGLKHGRHVDFNLAVKGFAGYDLANPGKHYGLCHKPVNPKGLLSNLLLTMAQRMGVEAEAFADSSGALSELT